jgi:hypothetical protein
VPFATEPNVLAVTVIGPPRLAAVTVVQARPLLSAITGLVVDSEPGPVIAKFTAAPGSGWPVEFCTRATHGCANGSPATPRWLVPLIAVTLLAVERIRFSVPPLAG